MTPSALLLAVTQLLNGVAENVEATAGDLSWRRPETGASVVLLHGCAALLRLAAVPMAAGALTLGAAAPAQLTAGPKE